ncbi:MAG: TRZ/ATZ family hydrolase [Betaproteobacteria bacterium]|nr:TRZ/ATZ family hydrolase [Betaproteobacteria bacterium]
MNEVLLLPRWIVPVRPHGVTLTDHALAVRDGEIVALLPKAEALREYSLWPSIDLPDHVLIPGLINLHTHSAMSLMRGLADDQPLMKWLSEHIWPAESVHVSPEFVRDGAQLACADMLKSGTTCFNDMYFFPEATAEAALSMRMRACIAMMAIEFPSAYAKSADEYLEKGLATRDSLRHEPLLNFTFGPHAPYTISDRTFERIARLSADLDVPVHIHIHETAGEVADGVKAHGRRPLARLNDLGLVNSRLISVHSVHFSATEIELMARQGAHVAHCPASNLKLASGIAPISELSRAAVNVGIGTDGAASNNRLDMLAEMRLAALLAKGASGDASAVPAADALAMATINAATALGLSDRIGSIEPGKRADLAALDFSRAETAPCFDVISHLVYAAASENVSHVWVDGELLLADRVLTRVSEQALIAKAQEWKARIQP